MIDVPPDLPTLAAEASAEAGDTVSVCAALEVDDAAVLDVHVNAGD